MEQTYSQHLLTGGGDETIIPTSNVTQRCPQFLLSFSTVFEALSETIRQNKFIKGIQTRKEVKLYPLQGNMALCLKDCNVSIRRGSLLTNAFICIVE